MVLTREHLAKIIVVQVLTRAQLAKIIVVHPGRVSSRRGGGEEASPLEKICVPILFA